MKPCCANPANRYPGPGPRGTKGIEGLRGDIAVTHCIVCECRHLEGEADPGQVGVKGTAL